MVLSAQEFMVRWEEVISWNSNSWEKFSSLKLLKSSDEVIVRKEGRDHQGSIKHRLWNPKTLIAWETLEEFGYPLLYLLALSTSVLVLGISRINICRKRRRFVFIYVGKDTTDFIIDAWLEEVNVLSEVKKSAGVRNKLFSWTLYFYFYPCIKAQN